MAKHSSEWHKLNRQYKALVQLEHDKTLLLNDSCTLPMNSPQRIVLMNECKTIHSEYMSLLYRMNKE